MSPIPEPSLTEIQEAFAHWRRERTHRGSPTPPALRAQAVQLLAHHRLSVVMKALGVDHRQLSRWRGECEASTVAPTAAAFVELPARVEEPVPAEIPATAVPTSPTETRAPTVPPPFAPTTPTSAALPTPPEPVALTLTRQTSDGGTVSLSGTLSPRHWQWALALLQKTGP